MLNHVSHAANGADNNPSEKRSEVILFDANSTSATSQTFSVNKDPVYIGCFNLSATDTFIIKMVTNVSPNEQYADYCPVDGPITLSETLTKYRLDMPGRYALLYTGPGTNYTSTIVKAFPGEMSHESNSHIAAALTAIAANIGSQSNAVVQGTAPITVTGNGAPATPYVIGATVATNQEVEDGVPANQLVDVVGLKHIVNATTAGQDVRLGVDAESGSSGPGIANISIGYNSSSAATFTQGSNINIGLNAGAGATFGQSNQVCIGESAGQGNTFNGGGNVIINATVSPTISGTNVVIGQTSSAVLSNGNNVLIGGAGSSTIVSGGVVAIGSACMQSAGTVSNAICIGNQVGLGSNGVPNSAILIGQEVARFDVVNASPGDSSIGIGKNAFKGGRASSNSIAIGVEAAKNYGTSGKLIAIGDHALRGASQITSSIAIGTGALSSAASDTLSGNSNLIGIGDNALSGYSTLSGGGSLTNHAIAIGKNAGLSETFHNTIIIGSSDVALNATQDNQIVLGNNTHTQLATAGSIIQGGVIGPSDKRLKKNVENYTSGLEAINKLRPVTFDWDENALKQANINILRDDINRKQHGLIAQELEEVFPTMLDNVNRGFGDYKFIHNDRLIPVMISAIKELSEQVKFLTKELNKKSTKKGVDDNG